MPDLKIAHGDCIEVMAAMDETSVDAIVTDPPYGIGFMGHEWDQPGVEHRAGPGAWDQPPAPGRTAPRSQGSMEAGKYDLRPSAQRAFQAWTETWAVEALRVLRPGGHLLCFASTRTYHRMASGLEDAGFEIRDKIDWLFGSGFPKSHNVGEGRGTALKPGHEPIAVARKPFRGTVAATVDAHGTGALNIDACRIPMSEADRAVVDSRSGGTDKPYAIYGPGLGTPPGERFTSSPGGRWPANVVLDEEAAAMLDAQSGILTSGSAAEGGHRRNADKTRTVFGAFKGQEVEGDVLYGDSGGASRFFYVAKPDQAERHAGLGADAGLFSPVDTPDRNDHPTVKPIDLMRWLVRLVTPPGGLVLDPFCGSGTTGCAAALEHRRFVGIEREDAYVAISRARLAHWSSGAVAA